jgi:hypothetical protein
MNTWLIVSAGVAAALIVISFLTVFSLLKKKRHGALQEPNYRGLFVFGTIWFFLGLALMVVYVVFGIPFWIGLPVSVLGLVYQFVGLANHQKWKKK